MNRLAKIVQEYQCDNLENYCQITNKKIGGGNYSEVFEAKIGPETIAVKILHPLKPVPIELGGDRMDLPKEVVMMAFCQNKHTPKLLKYDATEANGEISYRIAMSKINGTTLDPQTKDGQVTKPLSDNTVAAKVLVDMFEAVAFMLDKGVVPKDMKSDNFMVDREGHGKLIDFGSFEVLREGEFWKVYGKVISEEYGCVGNQSLMVRQLANKLIDFVIDPKTSIYSVTEYLASGVKKLRAIGYGQNMHDYASLAKDIFSV